MGREQDFVSVTLQQSDRKQSVRELLLETMFHASEMQAKSRKRSCLEKGKNDQRKQNKAIEQSLDLRCKGSFFLLSFSLN